MKNYTLTAVKLQTSDLPACETFFTTVFGFAVVHRYGGQAGDSFEEIVMTLRGEDGMMLKFIQFADRPALATGATIQIVVDNIDEAIAAAKAADATVQLEPTDYPEAGVCMAVITTNQNLDIELVRAL